ncbi:metallophosphoesterase family protein [Planctomycetota bacterium]
MINRDLSRRDLLKKMGQGAVMLPILGSLGGCLHSREASCQAGKPKLLRFGVCADVHMGVIHDAEFRMKTFVDRMNTEQVDFVIQLGDFNYRYRGNKPELAAEHENFQATWNQFQGPRYHVLGNHDSDGFTWEQTMAFWGMKKRYYSFDRGGYHFIVLDGNEERENRPPGYPRYIGPEQVRWLKKDLVETEYQTFIFSHQSLENKEGVENRAEIRGILEEVNQQSGFQKVVASFSGHHHIDYHIVINGIHYVQINSMSYQWLGGDYIYKRFSDEVEEANPWVRYTAPYKDPLYAIVTLEPQGILKIEGIRSEYIPPTPAELGYPEGEEGNKASPVISDRVVKFKA